MVAVVFLLGVGSMGSPSAGSDGMGQTRNVDVAEIRRQIGEEWLSDHEALYWQPIDEGGEEGAEGDEASPLY